MKLEIEEEEFAEESTSFDPATDNLVAESSPDVQNAEEHEVPVVPIPPVRRSTRPLNPPDYF